MFLLCEFGAMLIFLGADVSTTEAIVILTLARFAFLLPAPGGLGTLEAALVWTLAKLSVNPVIGIGASVLIRARDVLLALLGLWWGKKCFHTIQSQSSEDQS